VNAPRALWGINLSYFLEGLVYFGMLGYLAMHFSDFIFSGLADNDIWSHRMVMVLTAGITIAMFFLGTVADRKGVRWALVAAFCFLLLGRILISAAPAIFPQPGIWSPLHLMTMAGILVVVIGYGMYQPAAYAGVRKFTSEKTAAMGYAMLYALMNLGGYFPSWAYLLRDEQYLDLGIQGVYWIYTSLTMVALLATLWILTPRVERKAIVQAETERAAEKQSMAAKAQTDETATAEASSEESPPVVGDAPPAAAATLALPPAVTHKRLGTILAWLILQPLYYGLFALSETMSPWLWGGIVCGLVGLAALGFWLRARSKGTAVDYKPISPHLWISLLIIFGCLISALKTLVQTPYDLVVWGLLAALITLFLAGGPEGWRVAAYRWLANHPLADGKFFFFIFALIPVQTLFTYNWLILPQYIERAYTEGISSRFELFSNLNPLLIFIAVPIVTALTQKKKVYNMMVIGTFVMAAPSFLLALGTSLTTLLGYLFIMTIGEAMWQPRFLQYAAEIAPEGRTGAYMGVAQFPWFLTKVIAPLYTGHMIQRYCPADGLKEPQSMWLIFSIIAMMSTVLLILAKRWVGKDFKTKSA
jgi:MFS family permease